MTALNTRKLNARVARARSVVRSGCLYKLGAGGFNPKDSYPWQWVNIGGATRKGCDCNRE